MNALFKAIKDKFEANAALKASVKGRLFNTSAPQDEKYPYIVFLLVSDLPEDTFNTAMEDALVQFSIYSDDSSPEQAGDIFEKLKACFDYATLTIVGYTTVEMRRGVANLMHDPDDKWHYQVDYRTRIQEV